MDSMLIYDHTKGRHFMKLKTTWALWGVATILVLIASIVGVVSAVKNGHFVEQIDKWRDAFSKTGIKDDANPIKKASATAVITNYTGYIAAVLSLSIISVGHWRFYQSFKAKKAPEIKFFAILMIFTILAAILAIYGVAKNPFSDYVSKGDELIPMGEKFEGIKLSEAISDVYKSESLPTFGYISLVFSLLVAAIKGASLWGVANYQEQTML